MNQLTNLLHISLNLTSNYESKLGLSERGGVGTFRPYIKAASRLSPNDFATILPICLSSLGANQTQCFAPQELSEKIPRSIDLETSYRELAEAFVNSLYRTRDFNPEKRTIKDFLKEDFNLYPAQIPYLTDEMYAAIGSSLMDIYVEAQNGTEDNDALQLTAAKVKTIGEQLLVETRNKERKAESAETSLTFQKLQKDHQTKDEGILTKAIYEIVLELESEGIWIPHQICFFDIVTQEKMCMDLLDLEALKAELDAETLETIKKRTHSELEPRKIS